MSHIRHCQPFAIIQILVWLAHANAQVYAITTAPKSAFIFLHSTSIPYQIPSAEPNTIDAIAITINPSSSPESRQD